MIVECRMDVLDFATQMFKLKLTEKHHRHNLQTWWLSLAE